MVAYDSRRIPDPSQLLRSQTVQELRQALLAQRNAGASPISALRLAIRRAATEARTRGLPPESLIIQLKALAIEVGLEAPEDLRTRTHVREWMVGACLRAYWELPAEAEDEPE